MYANSVSKINVDRRPGTKVRMQTEVKTAEKQKSFYMYPVYPSAWSVNRKIVDKLFVTCPG